MSTGRRRPKALPLPELSNDSDEQQEGPSTPSAPDRRSQIPEGRCQPTTAPRRIATESGAQQHEAGRLETKYGTEMVKAGSEEEEFSVAGSDGQEVVVRGWHQELKEDAIKAEHAPKTRVGKNNYKQAMEREV
ncbi:hypothetical protein NDU88_002707 [Pleurodeles waltl]|uniref:Uncharacterized protein n=1 Tax=Pleurodeles waltl TaxID=8319 RepID=A0AAV7MQ77_PLEWA|nr:hypothetical protein NDU88_002707 [Pleurodeles waltl]